MKKKTLASILAFSFVFFIAMTSVEMVEAVNQPTHPPGGTGSPGAGVGTGSNGPVPGGSKTFDNPLGGTTDYLDVVANVVKVVLGVVGVLALVIFIYGGIVWMTSLGNSERVKQGRDTLVWASLGLIVVFASFAIVNLILSAFNTPKS